MKGRLKIPPTKSALLSLKRQVAFLEQGHSLLERKRELLTRLVYERLANIARCEVKYGNGWTSPITPWQSRICAWATSTCAKQFWVCRQR